ncbi:MAG: hypothetical protein M3Y57_13360 [Acidobacteriota bacterium]|nr:hypothetical protein [Acidobacteriota bacterium]
MTTRGAEKMVVVPGKLVSIRVTKAVIVSFALLLTLLAAQRLVVPAFGQTKPSVELQGAIAKEQGDGDLKAAILTRHSNEMPPPKELKLERLTANTPELPIQTAAISPDGKLIGYSDPLGIHIHSSATGETRLLPETYAHKLVQWMPDGNRLQTKVVKSTGRTEAAIVSLDGGTPTAAPRLDEFVSSPDRMHRMTVSIDKLGISIQDANGRNSRDLWKASAKSTLDQYQWGPTSKQIAISSSVRDADNNQFSKLELIDIASGKEKVLVPSEKKLSISSLVWANQDRLILVIDEDVPGVNQYNSNLWELRVNGAGELVPGGFRRLTTWIDFPIRAGSLSTDGKSLVFIRAFRQRDVYVASLEPDNTRLGIPKRFTLDLGDDYPSDWTRDSKTVILTSDRSGTQGIYRQDLDKLSAERIVTMPGHQLLARVTPDAAEVLFLNYDPAKSPHSQLMRVPIGGGTPYLVPNAEQISFNYRCPHAGVCIMAQKQGEGFVIAELDPAKGKGREIYRDSHVEHLDVSPDGKWISVTSGKGAETKIVIRSHSTGDVVREISLRGATSLVSTDWAPDGKGFFWGDQTLTEIREMYVDLSGNSTLLWRNPGEANSIWGIPSPDGKQLALVLLTDDSNVYTVKNF